MFAGSCGTVPGPPAIHPPCSLGVPLPELSLEVPTSASLELLVLAGLVRGELAGDADVGDGRGC